MREQGGIASSCHPSDAGKPWYHWRAHVILADLRVLLLRGEETDILRGAEGLLFTGHALLAHACSPYRGRGRTEKEGKHSIRPPGESRTSDRCADMTQGGVPAKGLRMYRESISANDL